MTFCSPFWKIPNTKYGADTGVRQGALLLWEDIKILVLKHILQNPLQLKDQANHYKTVVKAGPVVPGGAGLQGAIRLPRPR